MKNYKVWLLSTEHAEAVQARLAVLGFVQTTSGGTPMVAAGRYPQYIRGNLTGVLSFGYNKALADGYQHGPWLSLDDLYPVSKTPELRVTSLEIPLTFEDNCVKVGCQTISKADAVEIGEWLLKVTED